MEPRKIATRIDLLNCLIARRGYRRYLEIGCENNECFNAVVCADKTGVDPRSGGTVRATSDAYFASLPVDAKPFDLVFIDGLHYCQQVQRDVDNSLRHLAPGGVLVLHDCNPPTPDFAVVPMPSPMRPWNGDVWRTIAAMRLHRGAQLDVAVGDFDWGCGVVVPRPSTDRNAARKRRLNDALISIGRTPGDAAATAANWTTLPYAMLAAHRADLLRLMIADRLVHWIETGVEDTSDAAFVCAPTPPIAAAAPDPPPANA